jgi:hypothetical protein
VSQQHAQSIARIVDGPHKGEQHRIALGQQQLAIDGTSMDAGDQVDQHIVEVFEYRYEASIAVPGAAAFVFDRQSYRSK